MAQATRPAVFPKPTGHLAASQPPKTRELSVPSADVSARSAPGGPRAVQQGVSRSVNGVGFVGPDHHDEAARNRPSSSPPSNKTWSRYSNHVEEGSGMGREEVDGTNSTDRSGDVQASASNPRSTPSASKPAQPAKAKPGEAKKKDPVPQKATGKKDGSQSEKKSSRPAPIAVLDRPRREVKPPAWYSPPLNPKQEAALKKQRDRATAKKRAATLAAGAGVKKPAAAKKTAAARKAAATKAANVAGTQVGKEKKKWPSAAVNKSEPKTNKKQTKAKPGPKANTKPSTTEKPMAGNKKGAGTTASEKKKSVAVSKVTKKPSSGQGARSQKKKKV